MAQNVNKWHEMTIGAINVNKWTINRGYLLVGGFVESLSNGREVELGCVKGIFILNQRLPSLAF